MITLHAAEKSKLYQWDTGRRINIILDQNCDTECIEVQFATALNSALTVKPILISANQYVAEIPNIFLQDSMTISAYVVLRDENSKYVHEHRSFEVVRREKPDDYVYTETEVLSYEALEKRVSELEQSGGGGTGGIAKETDPTVPDWAKKPEKPTYTAEEVGALPEDTEIPDITDLENRVSELERGVANWEKVAEIPMNTETVIYELASVKEYPEVLVMIKRTYQAGNTASGDVSFWIRNNKGNRATKIYYIGPGFNSNYTSMHAIFNKKFVEVGIKNSNHPLSGAMQYTTITDNIEPLADTGMYALIMTLSWAQTILEGDTITVYGKRRS